MLEAERGQRQAPAPPVAGGGGQGGAQLRVGLAGAVGHGDHDTGFGRVVAEVTDELGRGRVRPVHVVEQEHDRPRAGQLFEQGAHRLVGPVPLGMDRAGPSSGRPTEGREHRPQLRQPLVETVERAGIDGVQVGVEGVDEDTEGQLRLELTGAPGEHPQPPPGGERPELVQQPALPDPQLADHLHDRRRAVGGEGIDRGDELGDLPVTTYESLVLHARRPSDGCDAMVPIRTTEAKGAYEAKSGRPERAESVRPLGSSHSSWRPRAVRSRK